MSDSEEIATQTPEKKAKPASLAGDAIRDLRKRPTVIFSIIMLIPIVLIAFFPSLFTNTNPKDCSIGMAKKGPEDGHPFGFSAEGCDYYAQTIYGAGPSVQLSLLVVIGTLVVGGLLGILAGYYGGIIDTIFSRAVDTFNSIPFLLGALLLLSMFRDLPMGNIPQRLAAILPAVAVLILFGWTSTMRLIRASVLESRNLDYVQAARSLGATNSRIMFRHILPNAMAPVMSLVPMTIAGMISAEATLSFLGVGVQKPEITWGIMISDATPHFTAGYPLLLIIPSVFLVVTVLSFVLLGDAIRDALDPKLR